MEPINIFIKRIYWAYGIKKENTPNINDNVIISGPKYWRFFIDFVFLKASKTQVP